MKANDLRIGNLVNYLIIDEMDERKKWFEVSEIDYDDLRTIQNKHEVNQDYQPIPLTEEWLLKFGFKKFESDGIVGYDYSDPNGKTIVYEKGRHTIVQWGITNPFFYSNHNLRVEITSVHQLQNLYYALTNQELTIK
jgi:hypothetical protein